MGAAGARVQRRGSRAVEPAERAASGSRRLCGPRAGTPSVGACVGGGYGPRRDANGEAASVGARPTTSPGRARAAPPPPTTAHQRGPAAGDGRDDVRTVARRLRRAAAAGATRYASRAPGRGGNRPDVRGAGGGGHGGRVQCAGAGAGQRVIYFVGVVHNRIFLLRLVFLLSMARTRRDCVARAKKNKRSSFMDGHIKRGNMKRGSNNNTNAMPTRKRVKRRCRLTKRGFSKRSIRAVKKALRVPKKGGTLEETIQECYDEIIKNRKELRTQGSEEEYPLIRKMFTCARQIKDGVDPGLQCDALVKIHTLITALDATRRDSFCKQLWRMYYSKIKVLS